MVDENRKTTAFDDPDLATPMFDDHASARAQPVTPIPKSRVTIFFEKAAQQFTNGSRSLALIVALGIATGAIVGMALVKEPPSSMPGPDERAAVLAAAETPQTSELQDVQVGVYGTQNSAARIGRSAIRRSRVQSNGQPRAYRFAVIR